MEQLQPIKKNAPVQNGSSASIRLVMGEVFGTYTTLFELQQPLNTTRASSYSLPSVHPTRHQWKQEAHPGIPVKGAGDHVNERRKFNMVA